MKRVTDAMVEHWLIWARNFGEIISYNSGRGPYRYVRGQSRRFRVRVTPGITANGAPFRLKEGIFDILGHASEDVVPSELMLTAREALVFGMGCAVGRAAALVPEGDWQRGREQEWTPALRDAFRQLREEARRSHQADLDREAEERRAERERRREAAQRQRQLEQKMTDDG